MSLLRLVPAALLTAALCACGNPVEVEEIGPGFVRVSIGDLEQTVEVTPRDPKVGERIDIWSVVINRGDDQESPVAHLCELAVSGGTLELDVSPDPSSGRCMLSHGRIGLSAGDSTVLSSGPWEVVSEPGTYNVRVRHLLDPDVWVTVPVVVEAE